jgi:hypothetical protein
MAQAVTSSKIYPTAYQSMQTSDSPLILAAIILSGGLLLYVVRNHRPTVGAALIVVFVLLCVTITGAALVGISGY